MEAVFLGGPKCLDPCPKGSPPPLLWTQDCAAPGSVATLKIPVCKEVGTVYPK